VRQHHARVARVPHPLAHTAGQPGGCARRVGFEGSGRGSHLTTPHGLAKRASPPGPDHLHCRCARRGRRPGSGLEQREHGTARGVTRTHGGTAGHGSESEAQALALNTDAVLRGQDGMQRALCGRMGREHLPYGGLVLPASWATRRAGCARRRQPQHMMTGDRAAARHLRHLGNVAACCARRRQQHWRMMAGTARRLGILGVSGDAAGGRARRRQLRHSDSTSGLLGSEDMTERARGTGVRRSPAAWLSHTLSRCQPSCSVLVTPPQEVQISGGGLAAQRSLLG
jgi:hypothetical protein